MRFSQPIVAILCLSATPHAAAAANATAGPIVTVPNWGKVLGLDLGPEGHPTLAEFRGIPYAQPPVGPLRWQPPEPHPGPGPDSGTFNATAYGFACHQQAEVGNVLEEQREDCLFLNVITPKAALEEGATKLPVMILIHGGAYYVGSGDEFELRRASLVDTSMGSIVLVSMNYRLGVFGFLASSDLMERGKGAGNFGLQDQQVAMAWVKANIGAFGGDSSKTTIFGQSAGGASVLQHLVWPGSFGMYQRGIIQSGAYNMHSMSMEQAEQRYQDILAISGCGDLQCLVDREATEIMTDVGTWFSQYSEIYGSGAGRWSLLGSTDWMPVVDGKSLVDTPSSLIAGGKYNKDAPVIVGSVRDEWAGLGPEPSATMTEDEFDKMEPYSKMGAPELAELKRMYTSDEVTYPDDLGGYSKWAWIHERYFTNNMAAHGACSVRWVARLLADAGSPAVYSYLFAHSAGYFPLFSAGGNGVFVPHAIDMLMLFNDMGSIVEVMGGDPSVIPDEDNELAKTMAGYWLSFATSDDADPNSPDAVVTWPKFTPEGDTVLRLDVASSGGIRLQQGLRKAECDWQMEKAFEQGVMANPGPHATAAPAGTDASSADARKGAPSSSLLCLGSHLIFASVSGIVAYLM